MTACVTFAVPTAESIDSLRSKLEAVWKGFELSVIVLQEANPGELTCYLEWWFGTEDQKEMVQNAFKILLNVSITGEVFYYRSSDIPAIVPTSLFSIEIEEIFSEEFSPIIGYYKEERYKIIDNRET
ncbi:MAG: hypothetical protein AAF921_06730 [Cyanobacteria bacterium P01_D01_bin.44]